MRATLLAVPAMLMLALATGCNSSSDKPTVDVELRVNVCSPQGQKCFALGVPSAEIKVQSGGKTLAQGTTDAAGRVKLTLGEGAGDIRVTATSPLLDGGTAETTVPYPSAAASVTLNDSLAADVASPK